MSSALIQLHSQSATLKVQSCKLCNNKYMIGSANILGSAQITNAQIFAFMVVLFFKSLGRKVLFINKKTIETIKKIGYFLRK